MIVSPGRFTKNSAPAIPTHAMSERPEASPSSPSIRLNAFTAPTIQNTVTAQSSQPGIDGNVPANPTPAQKCAATATATCPSSFTFGGSESMSSTNPSTTSAAESRQTLAHSPTAMVPIFPSPKQATTASVTVTARKTASPPARGMGVLLMRRGPGLSTMPSAMESWRTTGTSTRARTHAPKNGAQ